MREKGGIGQRRGEEKKERREGTNRKEEKKCMLHSRTPFFSLILPHSHPSPPAEHCVCAVTVRMNGFSHAVSCSQLVFWDDERYQWPEGAR